MLTQRRARWEQARRDAAWAALAFLFLQVAFVLAFDLERPGWCDSEYQARLTLLQAQVREHPDRPILVVIGSSRIGAGFVPQELPPLRTAEGKLALPFNFAHLTAGPQLNVMQVHRLLRNDIVPSWLVVELVPGGMVHENTPAILASAADLPVLWRCANRSRMLRMLLVYFRCRLNIFCNSREAFLSAFAPPLVTKADGDPGIHLLPLGDDDNWMRREDLTDAARAFRATDARNVYYDRLQDWQAAPHLDRAMRAFLELGRDRHIPVVVLLTPENSQFRSWYSAKTERRLAAYLDGLRREFGVRVVDARAWVEDDGFNDPHHLRLRGARVLTDRLRREVLVPLVADSSDP